MFFVPLPRVDTEKNPAHLGTGLLQGLNRYARSTTRGVTNFVLMPYEGAKSEGATGFVKGLGSGTMDLAAGIAGGTMDFVDSTIEGARNTPDAIADLTSGGNRQRKRFGSEEKGEGRILETRLDAKAHDPAHVGQGLAKGAKAFGAGVSGGAKALVIKPVEGAKEGGATGFVKGLGRGISTAASSSFAGTLDLASSVTNGLKNTPNAVRAAAGVAPMETTGSVAQPAPGRSGSADAAAQQSNGGTSGANMRGGPTFAGPPGSSSRTGAPTSDNFRPFQGQGQRLGGEE